MSFAYYKARASDFVDRSIGEILSELALRHAASFSQIYAEGTIAWATYIPELQGQIREFLEYSDEDPQILLEYEIPRLRSRIDCVLLFADRVVVLEFKSGTSSDVRSAKLQALRYRQELKDFHSGSNHLAIIPIVVGPDFGYQALKADWNSSDVVPVASTTINDLTRLLVELCGQATHGQIPDPNEWDDSIYFPVPTIVEAITELFNNQDISEIANSKAGVKELSLAVETIEEAIADARANKRKILCVLTGVPGAGKTLVGLSAVASIQRKYDGEIRSVFLSGNSPLVKVLRESLYRWIKKTGWKTSGNKKGTRSTAESFVQEMHSFLSGALKTQKAQGENVLIFDEAQRGWSEQHNRKKAAKNSKDESYLAEFNASEAEIVLRIMDRNDWGVVVALVGGGQEIHTGEAGLGAWGDAIAKFSHWKLITSPKALEGDISVAGTRLFHNQPDIQYEKDCRLHLDVSKRSLESETHAQWTNLLLDGRPEMAKNAIVATSRPVLITRDLNQMRGWLKRSGTKPYRSGLAVSSGGVRIRAYGIAPPTYDYMKGVPLENWFLDEEGDIRSSYQLEVAMSEFELQGLELDYVGLCWGGDLIWQDEHWQVRSFGKTAWKNVKPGTTNESNIQLTFNKYRVLLTRFRKAMVIFVPPGTDQTTDVKEEMDLIADVLIRSGCKYLNE